MKNFKLYLFTAVLLSVILIASCKKTSQDDTYPEIKFYSPSNGSVYNMFDSVYVSAYVSDETKLTTVSVNLTNLSNSPVQQGVNFSVSGKDLNIAFKYELYEYHLPSGYYTISITANDGYNSTFKQQEIYINASPTFKTGYYFFSDNGTQTTIDKLDTGFTTVNTKLISGKYSGSSVSSYYQRLYVAGGISQDFQAFDITTNMVKWNVQNLGAGTSYFSWCDGDGTNAFLGFKDGRMKRYDQSGVTTANYNYSNTDYYTQYGAVHSNYYIGYYQSRSTSAKKLIVFNLNSGLPVIETPVSFTAVGLFKKTITEAYVIGNDNSNQGQLNILNINTAGLSSPINLPPGNVLSACRIDSNTVLIGHSNGSIYEYQYSNNNLIPILTGITADRMKYNEGENFLYVSSAKQLNVYSVGNFSLSLAKNHTYSDTIRDFQVIYNK